MLIPIWVDSILGYTCRMGLVWLINLDNTVGIHPSYNEQTVLMIQ